MADIPVEKLTGRDTWISSVALAAIVELERDGVDVGEIFARCKSVKSLDMILVIDGHELPAEFFFDRFGPSWDEHVDRRARELVEERMGDKLREIDDALDDVRRGARGMAREHFPLWCSDEDD